MKKIIILAFLFYVLGCEPVSVGSDKKSYYKLPSCSFMYIGDCKYIWCESYSGHGNGLESLDHTCKPENTKVSAEQ